MIGADPNYLYLKVQLKDLTRERDKLRHELIAAKKEADELAASYCEQRLRANKLEKKLLKSEVINRELRDCLMGKQ